MYAYTARFSRLAATAATARSPLSPAGGNAAPVDEAAWPPVRRAEAPASAGSAPAPATNAAPPATAAPAPNRKVRRLVPRISAAATRSAGIPTSWCMSSRSWVRARSSSGSPAKGSVMSLGSLLT